MSSRRHVLRCLAVPGALGVLAATARGAEPMHIVIGANPGGGYDQVGRALGAALQQAGVASTVEYENKGGAGGMIALAHFVKGSRGDAHALLVSGAVLVGAIVRYKPPITLADATPIARLMAEYNVFVVPARSPLKSMNEVVERMRRDPASVKWGGGSKGSIDHLSVAMIARAGGVDAGRLNYVPFKGGGEAAAAVLGGHVSVAVSGWAELQEYVRAGALRALAITAPQRIAGIAVPTLAEQGIGVELANWRGVHAPPGLDAAQREGLVDAVSRATRTPHWSEALARNGWTPMLLTASDFERFVEAEHGRLRGLMQQLGMS
jgi:putative tricarboxylic transport membrane protein